MKLFVVFIQILGGNLHINKTLVVVVRINMAYDDNENNNRKISYNKI